MSASWMLYSLVVAVLIALAAMAAERFCRMLRLPVRWVWIGGMVVALALSGAGLLRMHDAPTATGDGVRTLALQATAIDASATTGRLTRMVGWLDRTRTVARGALASGITHAYAAMERSGWTRAAFDVLAVAWAMCTTVMLLVMTATLLRLRRARSAWRPHRIGGVSVLVSPSAGPALIGLLRPAIVVPGWLLMEPAERQRLVVQHETEHRRAGDHVVLAVACVAVCMVPWNIAFWWMLMRLRIATELDCDARVLRGGAHARTYATLLLDIAGRTQAHPFGAPALADSGTHLERRLIAMTGRTVTPKATRAVAAGSSALLLVLAACAADLPTAAAIEDMDVEAVQREALRAGLSEKTTGDGPLFLVDGVRVPEEAARNIAPEEIRVLEVVRAKAAERLYGSLGENGAVLVATRSGEALRELEVVAERRMQELEVSGTPLTFERTERVKAPRAALTRLQADELALEADPTATMRLRDPSGGPDSPLIVVDGVIAPDSFRPSSLAPESIERIEILKNEAARLLYKDPRAVNGVIRITTKTGSR